MLEMVKQYLSRFVTLPPDDLNALMQLGEIRTCNKKVKLVDVGEIEKNMNLVVKGLVRKYFYKGTEEVITQLAKEGELINSSVSFLTDTPSAYVVETIEPTTFVSFSRVNILKSTRDNLESLNFDSYYPQNDNYQVGLLLPHSYTKNKIVNITKELNKWDKVLKTFKELVGESADDTEINFVSNGTLEFFIDNSPAIGIALAYAVEKIIKVYKNIVEIRQTRDKLKELGLPPSEQKSIEKQEKEHLSKELDKISTDIIKEFATKKIEAGRLNELKVAIKGHVVYIAKCIDNGITIEINPPEIEAPEILSDEEAENNKAEIKKAKIDYDKRLKQIEIVQKSMDTLKTVGKFGIDIGKFLTNDDEQNKDE